MNLYLVPKIPQDSREVLEIISRSGVTFVQAEKLRDVFKAIYSQDSSVVIVSLSHLDMTLLSRHIETLLEEIPSVITSIPGVEYPHDWMQASTSLFGVDWMEMEGKLAKSGLLAHSTKDHDKKVEREANQQTLSLDGLTRSRQVDKPKDLDDDADKPFDHTESIV